MGDISRISSFRPRKKITKAAAKKYWNSEACKATSGIITRQLNIKPAKMPRPPSEGIGALWIFLASGTSYSFLPSATKIITGIARKVMVKAIATDSNISNIE
jgi:hypothetical protein